MKKSSFIDKVLKSKSNTVFVTPGQVENAIEVFTKLGMIPPVNSSLKKEVLKKYSDYFKEDELHGVVCKYSWRDYQNKVPSELLPFLKEENMGDYTMVVLNYEALKTNEWED